MIVSIDKAEKNDEEAIIVTRLICDSDQTGFML
jgi:hypothetical protein